MTKRKITIIIASSVVALLAAANILVGIIVSWDAAKAPWDFISSQILGMKWLNDLIWKIVQAVSGVHSLETWQYKVQSSIQFFVYDIIKITVLLCFLIFVISYIQSYFPPERTKKILSKYHGIGANIIGALLGTVTPFCSCSSIPIFIGFTRAGLSTGVTFSFLISSPLVDLGSLMLLVGFLAGQSQLLTSSLASLFLSLAERLLKNRTGKTCRRLCFKGRERRYRKSGINKERSHNLRSRPNVGNI